MTQELWNDVDGYFTESLRQADDVVDATIASQKEAGLPPIQVSAGQGKWLAILVRTSGARRVLEVGTLGGYSAIWMGRELPPDGRLVSLEIDPKHADLATANLDRAGLSGVAEVRLGPAVDSLAAMEASGEEPFDVIFIDADKQSNADYFAAALRLSHPGSVIVVDNVVRNGAVVDAGTTDEAVKGVRRLVELMQKEEAAGRVFSAALQTVSTKGYDGFTITVVN